MKKIPLVFLLCLSMFACGSTSTDSDYPSSDYPETAAVTKDQVLYTSFPCTSVLSDGSVASVDYSNSSQGYIGIQLISNPGVKVKLQVSKDGNNYNYDITSTSFVGIPLQLGSGNYDIKILEQVEGTSYAVIASTTINASIENDLSPYLYPSQIVNYNSSSKVVTASFKATKGDTNDLTRVYHIFQYVLNNLSYDESKAESLADGYALPDIDGSLKKKKGICFDYAAIMAAMCRIQKIPCRVIVGNTDIEYHAWCEVYLQGTGWVNPKVYFEGNSWELMDPTFSDSSKDYEGQYSEVYHY